MPAYRRGCSPLVFAAAIFMASASFASSACAQVGEFGGATGTTLTSPPVLTGRDDPFSKTNREYSALPVGSWLLYPTLFFGGVFDNNVGQAAGGRASSAGARLVPSLLAETTDGIHKTTLYGMADARFYGDNSGRSADTVAARAGVVERYQPMPDLLFNLQGDYTRQRDLFSTFGIDHSVTTLNPTAIGLAPTANPLAYNQFSTTASVQKTFGSAFVSLGGSVVDIRFDGKDINSPSPDGTTYTGTARGGFWFTPVLYAYAEGSVDQRRYSNALFNSSGSRTLGGIGSDQIGLFRGEVYGGYQSERHDFGPIGSVTGSVFGGRVYYYPLRELTLSASFDEALGVSLLGTNSTGGAGVATKARTALLQATYALAREWTAGTRFGFIHTDYINAGRLDDAWTVGATVTYSVWYNFGLTLDYQRVQLNSNVPLQGFTRDVVSLGGTYKY